MKISLLPYTKLSPISAILPDRILPFYLIALIHFIKMIQIGIGYIQKIMFWEYSDDCEYETETNIDAVRNQGVTSSFTFCSQCRFWGVDISRKSIRSHLVWYYPLKIPDIFAQAYFFKVFIYLKCIKTPGKRLP